MHMRIVILQRPNDPISNSQRVEPAVADTPKVCALRARFRDDHYCFKVLASVAPAQSLRVHRVAMNQRSTGSSRLRQRRSNVAFSIRIKP